MGDILNYDKVADMATGCIDELRETIIYLESNVLSLEDKIEDLEREINDLKDENTDLINQLDEYRSR